MGDHKSGAQEAVKGTVEGIKGKAKEVGGTLAGRDDLVDEGQAQQDKADAQRDAAKKEAEAESARAGAKAAEQRQKENQCVTMAKTLADGIFRCANPGRQTRFAWQPT